MKITSSERILSWGYVTINAPMTAAIAPLAPRFGTVELGSAALSLAVLLHERPQPVHRRSRPRRAWRTRPAAPRVWRCFVIAWRVTPVPRLSRVIESGPSTDRRLSKPSRVASASAVKTGTTSLACSAAPRLRDIPLQILDLPAPPLGVHAERFRSTRERDPIESGLDDRE